MRVVCLPGDGIGPEIMAVAQRVLEPLPLELETQPIGGVAIREHGTPLPASTLEACRSADAVLLAAVGGPEFDGREVRPEQGLLELRRELDVYANLRPAKDDRCDMVIVRELVGGLYFGRRGRLDNGTVFDTCEYDEPTIERLVRRGFELARTRRRKLTSVDKANVLATSRLWRGVVERVREDYPGVAVEHMLVDNAAMQLARAPQQFDVIVTENMFGDILSDLGDRGVGLFEPVHGSAPDIAGKGIANPTAMLRSAALMLEHAFSQDEAAWALREAVEIAMRETPTPDLGGRATTQQFADKVVEVLSREG
jgi:3-isopropylmalate dehydrogenase